MRAFAGLAQDLRYAARALRRSRSFVLAVIAMLALGIGANTAIFAAVERVVLHPWPYTQAYRLVSLSLGSARYALGYVTPRYVVRAWRERSHTLDGIEAYSTHDLIAYDSQGARLVQGMSMTPGLPGFLGVAPELGRALAASDAKPGAARVVLISHALWQRDYAGAKDVLGRKLKLDDVAYTVVGVMPAHWVAFADEPPDVWLPLSLDAAPPASRREFIGVIARLKPGVPVTRVRSELDALVKQAQQAAPNARARIGPDVATLIHRPGEAFARSGTRNVLLLLLAAVGLVLLVACANVANLLLARGASRSREIALRAALGAGRWRVVRQLTAESLIMALAAGVIGVGLGWVMLEVLSRLGPANFAGLAGVRLDPLVLAFTFGLSLVTGAVFGLVPALQLPALSIAGTLRHRRLQGAPNRRGARLRRSLVIGEMAIALILLVSAGLLVRSMVHLQRLDVGFDTRNLFAMQLSLPRARYQKPADRGQFAKELLDRIRAVPGVVGATQALTPPGHGMKVAPGLQIRGRTLSRVAARAAYALNYVQPNYFKVLGIRLLKGRVFSAAEMRSGQAVIVNEGAARRFWPHQDAVGRQLRIGRRGDDWVTVVGVVDDVATRGLTRDAHAPELYLPYRPADLPVFLGQPPRLEFIVRSATDPAPAIAAIRAATRALDAEVAIPDASLATTALNRTLATPRIDMTLLAAFAFVALVLAAMGLAAVVGYTVTERTAEIGIRMALGAGEAKVLRLVVGQGVQAAVVGVALGVAGALAATRLLSHLLYGVSPTDPLTFLGVVVLLLVVALAASWLPARRAARIDPAVALRAE